MARSIDHLVLAVRDLDQAGRFYGRLGCQVGGRNRHPWGTENRIVQLPGAFLELITVGNGAAIPPHGDRFFSFGAFLRDYLHRREGLAMLALASGDAAADASRFAGAGMGDFEPFFFERTGLRPDGAEVQVAFTLAFARDQDATKAGFFVCQHHRPEHFWSAALQQHPNAARGLSSVVLASPAPARHRTFLEALADTAATDAAGSLSLMLGNGRLDVLDPPSAAGLYGPIPADPDGAGFVAFGMRLHHVAEQAERLDAAGIPYRRLGCRLVVPSSTAFGVSIAFEPEPPGS